MEEKYPVEIRGTVRRYKGNGRKLGYPTANIGSTTKLADGVYFGYADLAEHKDQPALIFIGTPTTVGDKGRRVEAHLLDIADQDHYSKELHLSVEHHHRPNQTFKSIDELVEAMAADEQAGRQWFAQNPANKRDPK